MPTVQDVLDAVERIAPARMAFPFDRIGLQVGSPEHAVEKGVVSLDSSLGAIRHARALGAQMLVSHHPLIWEPIKTLRSDLPRNETVVELIRGGIAFHGVHTNWDCAPGGINDVLAERLGLTDVRTFGDANPARVFKLVVFVPHTSSEGLVDALSAAGAGVIGLYTRCAFSHPGIGTFRGERGSQPIIGEVGRIEQVEELRIEMRVPAERVDLVEAAIRRVHPYEEPAFDWLVMRDERGQPAGRIGTLPHPMTLREFSSYAEAALETKVWAWGDPGRVIRSVGLTGGAADGEWRDAQRAGAEVFLTGEVRQNVAIEVAEADFAIFAAGHYATEQPGCRRLAERLTDALPTIGWSLYEPEPGHWGRPS
ncbi:MAG TPA: Nif3-like dinuclear metal center hexameric protein [Fimbriimonadaceae bacterium]|nr:Nif3-like dinuclear metal center hexameric protein [Fimbriimonadaceae bacterium]